MAVVGVDTEQTDAEEFYVLRRAYELEQIHTDYLDETAAEGVLRQV